MNEVSLVGVVEPVASLEPPMHERAVEPASAETNASMSPTAAPLALGRAWLISLAVALLLAALAFWPPAPEPYVARPTLKAPIVFDVLNSAPLPQVTSAASAPSGAPAAAGRE